MHALNPRASGQAFVPTLARFASSRNWPTSPCMTLRAKMQHSHECSITPRGVRLNLPRLQSLDLFFSCSLGAAEG